MGRIETGGIPQGPEKPRILCLDDCRELLFLMGRVWEEAGFEVWSTSDEAEAMCLLCFGDRIDLFTQDLERPCGEGGWQVLRWVKAHPVLRHIPVLIISAHPWWYASEQMAENGIDSDALLAGYLTKPFTPARLVEAAQAAIKRGR